jgi:hypothetical protein
MRAAILALFLPLAAASAEELLKATDFTQGKGGWQGAGTVVYLAPDGGESSSPVSDSIAVLRVNLSKNRWSVMEHRVRFGKKDASAELQVELNSSANFQPLPDSKEYASEDLREGGQYSRPARLFTKSGLLVQLSESDSWHHHPKAVKADSGWQKLTAIFQGNKFKPNETLALCLPPGEGYVDIQKISLESR